MHRVHIRTYGCQMNERDSEGVGALLRSKGYVLVADEAEADIILINTCSIRGLAEEKAIGKADHLLRARREGKGAKFVGILGCMAQNRGAELFRTLTRSRFNCRNAAAASHPGLPQPTNRRAAARGLCRHSP